jgi:hypothetical protein
VVVGTWIATTLDMPWNLLEPFDVPSDGQYSQGEVAHENAHDTDNFLVTVDELSTQN